MYDISHEHIKQAGFTMMPLTCIFEVLSLSLIGAWPMPYGSSQSLQGSAWKMPLLCHSHFSSNVVRGTDSMSKKYIGYIKVKVTLRLTVSQYVLVSSPVWDLWPDITSCLKVSVWKLLCCLYGEPSLKRGQVCSLQCSRSELVTILYCLIWDSPNLED
jgi:hypothetical protein